MKTPRQTLVSSAIEAQPHPSDKEIYLKPISLAHQNRPFQEKSESEEPIL